MKIAVFGAGGVGGYFGGRLAEAGHEVAFVARGAHLAALQSEGLRVLSIAGDFHLQPFAASDTPAAIGPVDAVLVAVKTWQVPEVARALGPLLRPDTFVVPLENGVEAVDQIAQEIGAGRVVPGLCRILAFVGGPGLIRHTGVPARIEFAERGGRPSERVARLRAAFETAKGLTVGVPDDIDTALWEKFLFIAPVSAVGAVTRMPVGVMRSIEATRAVLEATLREVFALARARGIALPADAVERTLAYVDGMPAEATTSMQRDILDGRPSELEAQTGAIVRMAQAVSLAVPVNTTLYGALLPLERKARGML